MSFSMMWRKSLNVVMLSLTGACALLTVSVLGLILGYLVWHGGTSLSWDFFTKLPKPVGDAGGEESDTVVRPLEEFANDRYVADGVD